MLLVLSYKQKMLAYSVSSYEADVPTLLMHKSPQPSSSPSSRVSTAVRVIPTSTPNEGCNASDPGAIRCWISEDILRKDGVFNQMLKSRVGVNNTIILASVDSAFIDVALNMYETSFQKLNIRNFLYVCSDVGAVTSLKARGVDCFHYQQNTMNTVAVDYGTTDFILKMRVKMKMVTAALMLNFTVLLTDIDVVFIRNPLPDMRIKADVAFMSDLSMDNCGFYIARPTASAVKLHQDTLRLCMTRLIADQNAIAAVMKKSNTLQKVSLSKDKFSCGVVFYERNKRMFATDNPCNPDTCISDVVHNNWIVGKAAKVYRFKETGMWLYEKDGYYSDVGRKYLMYSNVIVHGKNNFQDEQRALQTALTLGRVLNRTVILPTFNCNGCIFGACRVPTGQCSLNTHFHVKTFDAYFHGLYREHVFLSHPKVPASIKASISPLLTIKYKQDNAGVGNKTDTFVSSQPDLKPTATEIRRWFSSGWLGELSVLNFRSLNFELPRVEADDSWAKTLKLGIRKSGYRQGSLKL